MITTLAMFQKIFEVFIHKGRSPCDQLVPSIVHTKGQPQRVAGTCPSISSKFEFVRQLAGTKLWYLRLDFLDKNGSLHEGTSPWKLVGGTSHRALPFQCCHCVNVKTTSQGFQSFLLTILYCCFLFLFVSLFFNKIRIFDEVTTRLTVFLSQMNGMTTFLITR